MSNVQRVGIPMINLSSHGGVRVLIELSNYLVSNGYSVTIFVPKGRVVTQYKIDPRVRIMQCGFRIKGKFLSYLAYLIFVPFYLKGCRVVIANFFPTFYPSALASIFYGSKVLYFLQDLEAKYTGFFGAVLNFLCRSTYRGRSTILAANKHIANELNFRHKIKIDYADIGLSEKFFSPSSSSSKNYDLIYFLRHEPWKRKELFSEVVSIIKGLGIELRVICVTQDKDLLAWAKNLGVDVVSPANDEELIHVIDQSKVMLLTSSLEGFGLPPLECMSRGVPAVVFECGGPNIYIRNELNSYIVRSSKEAVDKITGLLSNVELYSKISCEAADTSKEYRNIYGFEKIERIIKRLVDGS